MPPAQTLTDLGAVAEAVDGRVDGDRAFGITALASLENANREALAFFADPKQKSKLETTAAGAVMLRAEHAALFAGHKVIVADPYLAYARASALFLPQPNVGGQIHPTAIIADSAKIDANADIGAYCVIGENSEIAAGAVLGGHVSVGANSVVGRDSFLDAGVRVYDRVRIGARCRISSGVVIGGPGFGYVEVKNNDQSLGAWQRIEQLGGVVIGDDVDIGANTTIDRGAIDDTVIGNGVKLDNHIQIAHNVKVGDHTVMASSVAIAGSVVIGKRCRLGGRAGIVGHLKIADDVRINADSFVSRSLKAGAYSSMIPVQSAVQWRRTVARLHRLDQLAKQVKAVVRKSSKSPK